MPVRGSPSNLGWAPGSARCSARLTHIALASKPLESLFWFAYCGSGNVANRRPLGEIQNTTSISLGFSCTPGLRQRARVLEISLTTNLGVLPIAQRLSCHILCGITAHNTRQDNFNHVSEQLSCHVSCRSRGTIRARTILSNKWKMRSIRIRFSMPAPRPLGVRRADIYQVVF
jgi:hypothetical protein